MGGGGYPSFHKVNCQLMFYFMCVFVLMIQLVVYILMFMDPMEEQNNFVNDSEMGNPSILSVLIYFAIHISMYILLCMFFMIEWRINKQK